MSRLVSTVRAWPLVVAFRLAYRAGRRWPSMERGVLLKGDANGGNPWSDLRVVVGIGYKAGSSRRAAA